MFALRSKPKKKRKPDVFHNPEDDDDDGWSGGLFDNNPFLQGLAEFLEDPDVRRALAVDEELSFFIREVHPDLERRILIWPKKVERTLEESIAYTHKQYSEISFDEIEVFFSLWLTTKYDYDPKNLLSEKEFDRVVNKAQRWTKDYKMIKKKK